MFRMFRKSKSNDQLARTLIEQKIMTNNQIETNCLLMGELFRDFLLDMASISEKKNYKALIEAGVILPYNLPEIYEMSMINYDKKKDLSPVEKTTHALSGLVEAYETFKNSKNFQYYMNPRDIFSAYKKNNYDLNETINSIDRELRNTSSNGLGR